MKDLLCDLPRKVNSIYTSCSVSVEHSIEDLKVVLYISNGAPLATNVLFSNTSLTMCQNCRGLIRDIEVPQDSSTCAGTYYESTEQGK